MKWKTRIKDIEKRGFINEDKRLSHDFSTCPAGEKFGFKKNMKSVAISDKLHKNQTLWNLGLDFNSAVLKENIKNVKSIYNKIQKIKVKK